MKKTQILFLFIGYFLINGFTILDKENNTLIVQHSNNTEINDPFAGTWEWQNGNQIFRVHLWINSRNAMRGHFEMVEVNTNGEETIIYTSNKKMFNSTLDWLPAISGGYVGNRFEGRIMDNSIEYDPSEKTMWKARLEMKIITTGNCIGCNATASWRVRHYDLVPDNLAPLNIPVDIILTKVN